jgi:2'-5' RNA ligase
MHEQLLQLARSRGRLVGREQSIGRDFTPHIVLQRNRSALSGRKLKIDAVYVIEKEGNQRFNTVKAKINLA